ncbi:uncharacterized protein [Blastocystis hominis]|uniref:Uncharacterized protein n=1 Tax=Blastocystis hominis TaxID=12968 RepID=D8M5U4_BLAHO|nr:uncharacterized protein [Blastocystis hominis]CBK23543.2 unnamed protein product [Blastocystis hominis]|eukprot:XP_012897591.1 uncharacterized protein [Blastocystis hominis]
MNGEEFSIVYFPSYTLFASVLNMSINVSLKGSKTMDQSNQRLTSILSSKREEKPDFWIRYKRTMDSRLHMRKSRNMRTISAMKQEIRRTS